MIYHSLASVTLPNDLSHSLNRLTEDAMSIDANVYPTGIDGVYGRHHDTNNDNTEQWQHDDAQHDLTDAGHSCLRRNTTNVTTRTSTVLQLGRANSASTAGRVCTLDPASTRANNVLLALLLSLVFLLTVALLPILLLTAAVPVLRGAVCLLRGWMILVC